MNWFEKYSQEDMGGDGYGDPVGDGSFVENDSADKPPEYGPMLFDGPGVNKFISDNLLTPMNSIDPAVYEFLETIPSNPMARALTELAGDGMLSQFKTAVEAYGKEGGYYQDVVAGTESSLGALQEWIDLFEASGGNRSPFDTLEGQIRSFVES